MRTWVPILALLAVSCAGPPPLQIASVERAGLPPFEPGSRLYRVLGDGQDDLRVGDQLRILREGEVRDLGKLRVVELRGNQVLARWVVPGDTFPMIGDLLVKLEVRAMPALPGRAPEAGPDLADLEPRRVERTREGPFQIRREPIYFLRQDATLSPAGEAKLSQWVKAWGPGSWSLELPESTEATEALEAARVQVLEAFLKGLGIGAVAVRKGPKVPAAQYDPVFVILDPWREP